MTLIRTSPPNMNTGAFMASLARATERVQLMARVMAETGMRGIYRKSHELIRSYPDIVEMIQLSGDWVPVDPRKWRRRNKISINVSLAAADRGTLAQNLLAMLQVQREASGGGLATPAHIFHTLSQLIEANDLGSPASFFVDPNSPQFQPPQPQPDPQAILFEAQARGIEMEQARKAQEAQANAQLEGQRLQLAAQKQQMDFDIRMAEINLKLSDNERRDADSEIGRELTDERADLTAAQTAKTLAEIGQEPQQ